MIGDLVLIQDYAETECLIPTTLLPLLLSARLLAMVLLILFVKFLAFTFQVQ